MNKLIPALLLFSAQALALDITFEYAIPTQRVDGTTLSINEIEQFEVSASSGVLVAIPALDAQSNPVETYQLTGAAAQCYTIATLAKDGTRSAESGEVCLPAEPNAPTSFTIKFVAQ